MIGVGNDSDNKSAGKRRLDRSIRASAVVGYVVNKNKENLDEQGAYITRPISQCT